MKIRGIRTLKKIKNDFEKGLLNLGYMLKFKFLKNKFSLNKEKRDKMIVVSITSFPARIDRIYLSIQSMLLQKVKPDKIVVYIGDKEFENVDLPKSLTDLFKYGVEVRFRKDLKPHTKYFYAMQEFNDALIVTVDDDVYYSPNLIRDLYDAYKKHPNCVICTRAHKMIFSDNHLLPYNEWDFESSFVEKETHLLIATGVGGVLYNPQLFCNETFNEEKIIKLSLKNDDVWLKFMEIISGIKVYAIPSKTNKYVVGVFGSEKITLNSQNVGKSKNDIYIKNVIDEYNISFENLE